MSKRTVLMNKLFSDSTPRKFKRVFAESALEAKNSDESVEYQEGAEDLVFSVEGDEVLVEDRANKEMTKVSFSEEDPNEIQLEAIEEDPEEEVEAEAEEVPSEEEALEEEIHTESENLPSVEVEVLNGPDGEHADDIVDDLKIDIEEGINDDEKSGTKRFSLRFKNYSERKARNFARLFSDMVDQMEEAAGDDESEVEVGVEAEGEMTADALMEKANELAACVAEGVTSENAEDVKAKAEEILVEAEKLESKGCSCAALKMMCGQFCDSAVKAMSEDAESEDEKQYEEGFEAGEQYEEGKEAEAADEGDEREFSETEEQPEEEVVEDPAEEEQKEFSDADPKVTITVTNVEPNALSKLLGAVEEPKEEEEVPSFSEPKVDPNQEEGRQFSRIQNSNSGVSFLLRSEIN